MKTCSKCKIPKDETEFYLRKNSGKPQGCCRLCRNSHAKEEYQKNPEKYRALSREVYAKDPEKAIAYSRERYQKDPEKYRARSLARDRTLTPEQRRNKNAKARPHKRGYRLKAVYGLTPEMWSALLDAQGGVCDICKKVPTGSGRNGFVVDHDHVSKKVRGLLCNPCNAAIGMLKESVSSAESLIRYLRKHAK